MEIIRVLHGHNKHTISPTLTIQLMALLQPHGPGIRLGPQTLLSKALPFRPLRPTSCRFLGKTLVLVHSRLLSIRSIPWVMVAFCLELAVLLP